jgi:hypothetical protein
MQQQHCSNHKASQPARTAATMQQHSQQCSSWSLLQHWQQQVEASHAAEEKGAMH